MLLLLKEWNLKSFMKHKASQEFDSYSKNEIKAFGTI